MKASIGLNRLGRDPKGGHDRPGPTVNAAIEAIGAQEAFDATLEEVAKALVGFKRLKPPVPSGPVRVVVDLVSLSETVLAGLCAEWIGLPGGRPRVPGGRVNANCLPPRCPGHLSTTSRCAFAPLLRRAVMEDGPTQGLAALLAVEALLASGGTLGKLAEDIRYRLQAIGADQGEIARNIASVLLDFAPTVHGNFLRTMETWVEDKVLWACQQQLAEVSPKGISAFDRACQALRKPLFETLREQPTPEMRWRCPVVGGKPMRDAGQRVVPGMAPAPTDPQASERLMFGGSRVTGQDARAPQTQHACPGDGMGTGVLLGLIAGLLDAGTLRPTGSPVLLMLTPSPSPSPSPTTPRPTPN